MMKEIIQQAYNELLVKPDSKEDNILYRLSDWLCEFLSKNADKVLYFSLPIWDYLQNVWDSQFPMCISKQNDSYFKGEKGWYKHYNTKETIYLEDTDFGKFYTESNLNAQGFSFVEFITQQANNICPIFTIEFVNSTNGQTKYDLDIEKGNLSLTNNIVSEANREKFVDCSYKLIVDNKEDLDKEKRNSLFALYEFLCIYQQSFRLKYIYLITGRLFQENGRSLSSGGLILVCKDAISAEELNLISCIVNLCYREKGGKNWEEKCRRESIKSAGSAIMSRNMSHNLGSHFISNTKNFFNVMIDVDSDHEAIYRGIKYALQYIQERMDFIAAVTSDDVNPFGAVNAKAQLFDELTPDDLGARHRQVSLNFLMDYLVLSEKISKNSINKIRNLDYSSAAFSEGKYNLILQMGEEKQGGEVIYWDSSQPGDDERRDSLETINFAIPGGVLGRHAVFSIIENIIRNAAKHGQGLIQNTFRIRMLCTQSGRFVIFDNKKDNQIRTTVSNLSKRLNEIKMINDVDGALNQENKGLKEILICAIWLQNENFAQVLLQKQNEYKNGKYDDYVKIVAVDEEGKEIQESEETGYLGYSIRLERFEKSKFLESEKDFISYKDLKNLKADIICAAKDYPIAIGEKEELSGKKLSDVFARFLIMTKEEYNAGNDITRLKTIVEKNCAIDCDKIRMVLPKNYEKDFSGLGSCPVSFYDTYETGEEKKSKDDFLFQTHAGKTNWDKFSSLFLTKGFESKYVDSISGGDFTHTLVQRSFVTDKYNLYKIYESVKTRFVIIDERIFELHHAKMSLDVRKELIEDVKFIQDKMKAGEMTSDDMKNLSDDMINLIFTGGPQDYRVLGNIGEELVKGRDKDMKRFINSDRLIDFVGKDIEQHYLERRDIHLFSFESSPAENEKSRVVLKLRDLSNNNYGFFNRDNSQVYFNVNGANKFFENPNKEQVPITFLSIHLGLIDKIKDNLGQVDNPNFDESVIVETLKDYFDAKYVSIHSGRGGYDIRDSLKKYAFQSYSAVENPLHNSKFLLAQQFYNLKYYGAEEK